VSAVVHANPLAPQEVPGGVPVTIKDRESLFKDWNTLALHFKVGLKLWSLLDRAPALALN